MAAGAVEIGWLCRCEWPPTAPRAVRSKYWLAQTASYGLDAERDSTMAEHAVGEAVESEL